MSEDTSGLWKAMTHPSHASYGSRRDRLVSAVAVGLLTGVSAAMATYTLWQGALAPGWAGDTVMGSLVFAAGALVKLLCQNLKTSVLALSIAVVVGAAMTAAAAVAPYLLLDIGTLGGIALLPELRDVITLLVFGQVPLLLFGYLVAIVYDGATA
ncbi:hypothetical protein GRX01_09015 [Halobaculum sp. WSA2]|uniref:Uncharacterized protein n=1 Tax=Halobaculum saliterrae TaxID=2073113 RepID=A0A6B0SV30_9EURY|nr:hypothetical protein [Halobaculum saliterrae]MXR41476.1 hypothetical protein [Halobaculum saliterrae]